MHPHISESDWRHFKGIHERALERFCQRILDELTACARSTEGTAHDRYVRIYKLVHKRDKELANAFNDMSRSTATFQLAIMQKMDLLTAEDVGAFSTETREILQRYRSLGAGDETGSDDGAPPSR